MNSMSKIYYRCSDFVGQFGGVKVMYEHVDILNSHGFHAYILHDRKGFRADWFENSTKIAYVEEINLRSQDFLVFPEVDTKHYISIINAQQYDRNLPLKYYTAIKQSIIDNLNKDRQSKRAKVFAQLFNTPTKKVILNQGCYLSFKGYSINNDNITSMYTDKDVVAILVVSEDSECYMKYVFPTQRIIRLHNAINRNIFYYQANKRKQICFMERKNENDIIQVINIIKQRHMLDDFTIIPIGNMPQIRVAEIMRESVIFLSFGYAEGFSLPPAEAMACGCTVIGYHGQGGREYFKPEFCYAIDVGDIITMVKIIEIVTEQYREAPFGLIERGHKASEYILQNYTYERQKEDVLGAWREIHRLSQ